jgi:hypothetical protein
VTAVGRPERRGIHSGRLLPAVLALAVLVPLSVLFNQLLTIGGDRMAAAELERDGLEYLDALTDVTLALTEAQSAVVAGRPASRDEVLRTLVTAGEVDQRLGVRLRTTSRWTALRASAEALPSSGANPIALFNAYSETTDLLLALYGVVRINSQLIRDPDTDGYYLADAIAEELPEALVGAGRLADSSVVAASRPAAEQAATSASLAIARAGVSDPAVDLAADLQSAADGSENRTLSGTLLNRLDAFRRAIDALAPATLPVTPGSLNVDAARVAEAGGAVLAGASELADGILQELRLIIDNRLDGLDRDRQLLLGTVALAVLLTLLPLTIAAIFRPNRRRTPFPDPPAQPWTRDEPSRELVTVGHEPAGYPGTYPPRHPGRER